MLEIVETPGVVETAIPPVIDSLERKSSKKHYIYIAIAIIILLLVWGGYKFFAGTTQVNNQAATITKTPTPTPISDLPTNNNNEQLNKDVQTIGTQTTNLDNDLNNIDQGLNDQAVNLD